MNIHLPMILLGKQFCILLQITLIPYECSFLDESAGKGNILSSFQLVASQHDELDSSSPERIDGLSHIILQFVLDASCADQSQLALQLFFVQMIGSSVDRECLISKP